MRRENGRNELAESRKVALVVGVGAEKGLGAALCRKFAAAGHHAIAAGRTAARLGQVAEKIRAAGGSADWMVADATREDAVAALFDRAMSAGDLDLVVFNAGENRRRRFVEMDAAHFEAFWRTGCFAGFLVGREAARRLAPLGRGTVIFTGASGSLRGRAGFASFASAKAGLRMVAQAMARELGPVGLHVAHVVIDGGIDGDRLNLAAPHLAAERGADGMLDVDAIASNYWHLHLQHRSAWTHELDLRPYRETF